MAGDPGDAAAAAEGDPPPGAAAAAGGGEGGGNANGGAPSPSASGAATSPERSPVGGQQGEDRRPPKIPKGLCVCSTVVAARQVSGAYQQSGLHNQATQWAMGEARVYSDLEGRWRVTDSAASMEQDGGMFRSAPHGGAPPHLVDWEHSTAAAGAWEPGGVRINAQRLKPPQRLRVAHAEPSELCGVYQRCTAKHNNMACWEKGACRIYSDSAAKWHLYHGQEDEEDVDLSTDPGPYATHDPHRGLMPDEIEDSFGWQRWTGEQWTPQMISVRTLDPQAGRAERPVSQGSTRRGTQSGSFRRSPQSFLASYLERCSPVPPVAFTCLLGVVLFAVSGTLLGTAPGSPTREPEQCWHFETIPNNGLCEAYSLSTVQSADVCVAAAGYLGFGIGQRNFRACSDAPDSVPPPPDGSPPGLGTLDPLSTPACVEEEGTRLVVWLACNAPLRFGDPDRRLVCVNLTAVLPRSRCAYEVDPPSGQETAGNVVMVFAGVAVAAAVLCMVAPGRQDNESAVVPLTTAEDEHALSPHTSNLSPRPGPISGSSGRLNGDPPA
eukprot:TRINITY_DN56027_c0_g1_i1.p1 TRINITY_DN56027_c0_g1~~TRINITY_DN56027_c0_g1_i1.p1  ORF type:complete len:551 (+),score=115.03 TRINITY_DN56027_c0_g1_i1:96-1748(+)